MSCDRWSFVCVAVFVTLAWRHMAHRSPMKWCHRSYGSTIKHAQCYGATKPWMAPWIRHCGLASFGTPIVYEIDAQPVWADHKTLTMLWIHKALHDFMASPPWSGFICYTNRLSKSIHRGDHKTHTMLWSHRNLSGSMASPPWSAFIWHTNRLWHQCTTLMDRP